MIDDKKIEEAAVKSTNYLKGICDFTVINASKEGFRAGANWAINEFLKDLLHPADEEPKKNRIVLTDTQSIIDKGRICWLTVKLTENGLVRNWSNYAKVAKITRWLYIDDLFPKKGGYHD